MILDDLKKKLVEYQKSGDQLRVGILRYFLSQVQNKEIELRTSGTELTDEVVFKVLRKLVKDRKESIEVFQKAGRQDLRDKETNELNVLKEFAAFFPFDLESVPFPHKIPEKK